VNQYKFLFQITQAGHYNKMCLLYFNWARYYFQYFLLSTAFDCSEFYRCQCWGNV